MYAIYYLIACVLHPLSCINIYTQASHYYVQLQLARTHKLHNSFYYVFIF